ncbi:MAG: Asp-tRNA(Asn)/Glu-tRNA(Gln) amidotransferase GatCAB subunit A, partial [Clostridia bacterium]|nr:Asp-tRNA(Asn)/Glu-tRNA(Gln) amidotransferase GatCAB subunit A [Clostridia bacterium]
MDYLDCSLTEIRELLENGTITSVELTKLCLQRIQDTADLNALISTTEELALQQARTVDERRAKGEVLGPLAGIPIVIKDIINLEGTHTTCASKFLENFVSPYTATCADKLIKADAVIIGKANMDEFAMGSSNENSAFGVCKNPV